jgi:hypothetical protein
MPGAVVFALGRRAGHAPRGAEDEFYELYESDGLPFYDLDSPFEWKPSDWGRLDGRIVALNYSATEALSTG